MKRVGGRGRKEGKGRGGKQGRKGGKAGRREDEGREGVREGRWGFLPTLAANEVHYLTSHNRNMWNASLN